MNKVIAIGNMTDDPKITRTQSGKCKAEFTLALNRAKDGADFPRFIAWEKTAETIEKWCHKGKKLAVEGHIQTGSYDGKDGKKVYTTDIIVERFEFADKKDTAGQPTENDANPFVNIPDNIDMEIPFT